MLKRLEVKGRQSIIRPYGHSTIPFHIPPNLYTCSYMHACIIVIGFSFGGLLASAIAASVWDAPFISSDLLKENMTCITFGQPHVKIEVIQSVARRKPEMISTFHSVYLEDDHIPSVLSLLDECWSAKLHKQQSEGTVGIQLPLAADTNAVSVMDSQWNPS